MPNLQEILSKESENTHTLYFYREGVFFKAYERSAYLFVKYVKPFMVKKRFVKSVKQDVVSVGFPTNSLPNYFERDKIRGNENAAEVVLTEPVDLAGFDEWKQAMEHVPENEKKQKEVPPLLQQQPARNESMVIMKIKTFPMEAKTPLDCMIFLSEIKKML